MRTNVLLNSHFIWLFSSSFSHARSYFSLFHIKVLIHLFLKTWLLYLPALDRSAGLQATPEEPLPPSSAEPPRRPAAASRPVYQTGTAPGPSAGCALPLQGTSGKEPSVKLDEWPLRFYKTAPRRRTKRFSIVLILLARVKPHFPSSF